MSSAPQQDANLRRPALGVALLAFAAYATNLANGFAMDDRYNVVGNPAIRSLAGLPQLFTQAVGGHVGSGMDEAINRAYWRPVTASSWAVDHALFGLNPWGFHAVNNLLHGAVSALVVLLVARVWRGALGEPTRGGAQPAASGAYGGGSSGRLAGVVAGVVFAVHPLHSEAVNLVTYRTELLAALWCTLALWLRARQPVATFATQPAAARWRHALALWLCYALGLGSKEIAVTLPGWLLLLDVAQGRLARARPAATLRALAPTVGGLTAVLAGYFAVRAALLAPAGMPFFGALTTEQTVASVLKIHAFYLQKWLLPWPLNPFWDMSTLQPARSLADPGALVGGLALVTSTLWAARTLARPATATERRQPGAGQTDAPRWRRGVALGVLWWWLGLLPVSHLVPLPVGAGERFAYLPSVGLALALGALALGLRRRLSAGSWRAAVAAAAAWTLLAAGLTAFRGTHWRDDRTLLERVVHDLPGSFNGHHLLGQLHLEAGRCPEALASFRAADGVLPGFAPNQRWLRRAEARCATGGR